MRKNVKFNSIHQCMRLVRVRFSTLNFERSKLSLELNFIQINP